MTEQQTIYQEVSALLITLFEVAPEDITPEARLYEDLDLDSIDAVDMVVHLQKKTGHKNQARNLQSGAHGAGRRGRCGTASARRVTCVQFQFFPP